METTNTSNTQDKPLQPNMYLKRIYLRYYPPGEYCENGSQNEREHLSQPGVAPNTFSDSGVVYPREASLRLVVVQLHRKHRIKEELWGILALIILSEPGRCWDQYLPRLMSCASAAVARGRIISGWGHQKGKGYRGGEREKSTLTRNFW